MKKPKTTPRSGLGLSDDEDDDDEELTLVKEAKTTPSIVRISVNAKL